MASSRSIFRSAGGFKLQASGFRLQAEAGGAGACRVQLRAEWGCGRAVCEHRLLVSMRMLVVGRCLASHRATSAALGSWSACPRYEVGSSWGQPREPAAGKVPGCTPQPVNTCCRPHIPRLLSSWQFTLPCCRWGKVNSRQNFQEELALFIFSESRAGTPWDRYGLPASLPTTPGKVRPCLERHGLFAFEFEGGGGWKAVRGKGHLFDWYAFVLLAKMCREFEGGVMNVTTSDRPEF